MSDPVEPIPPIASSRWKQIYPSSKHELGYPVKTPQSHLDALEESLHKAYSEIEDLKDELVIVNKAHKQEHMMIKQEMMLDILKANESADKRVSTLNREKHYLQLYANEQKKEAIEIKGRLEALSTRYAKTLTDMNMYRQEAEHLQSLNKTMEEDLDELRRIENEDAAHRKKQAQGLPPAYGCLDDEDHQPPYVLHKDGGTFDIASLKRSVRAKFSHNLVDAQIRTNDLRSSICPNDKAKADMNIFWSASIALKESCARLKAALECAKTAYNGSISELVAMCRLPGASKFKTKATITREFGRCNAHRDYIADRIAKLILELSWRVIGACELRPRTLRLTSEAKAKLGLAYRDVDDCLLEALRDACSSSDEKHGTPYEIRDRKAQALFEYQSYLTQVETLLKKFSGLRAGVSYQYFNKSMAWLCEKVETERFHQANAVPQASNSAAPAGPRRADENMMPAVLEFPTARDSSTREISTYEEYLQAFPNDARWLLS